MNDIIQFKDTEATLESFHYMDTYSGFLEGHPMYASWHLLKDLHEMMEKEEELIFVHKGEVISAEKLNEIEHFDEAWQVKEYVNEVLRPNNLFWPTDSDNWPFIVLGRGKYVAHFHSDIEHLLTMVWYDGDIDTTKPLKEIIEEKTRSIEYKKYSKFVDLSDF